ncbi:hypothetical protein BZG35_15160 [Brevundimonas sp. LM2]|uniref:hypothetical protein n=1 Tax=Brevundimonas sp. LM2 TaxID=1938605 RepID=UPI000983A1F9|nr:hypothetical protein [Brevundimonas sp. LM2]AQR62844.1 hypothetical protein BZG35_15160 [Brevundimonas sp. LM2]
MSVRMLAVLSAAAALAACAPTVGATAGNYAAPAPFSVSDFAWSARTGTAAIDGRVAFGRDGQSFDCTGSVALTPDTPYTRQRFRTLYGSTEQAAIPEAVVRARTVSDPNADYRSYVRSQTCQDGRFRFSDLPAGGWFLITPVSAGGERVILMRHVVTRSGAVANVTL